MSVVRGKPDVVCSLFREKLVDESLLEAESASRRQDSHRLRHWRITVMLLTTVSDDQECTQANTHPLYQHHHHHVYVIYQDFQKAFDKVPHNMKIQKLRAHSSTDSEMESESTSGKNTVL